MKRHVRTHWWHITNSVAIKYNAVLLAHYFEGDYKVFIVNGITSYWCSR